MTTNTKYFGMIDYDNSDVLSFPNGIFGFEDEHEFLLLPFGDSSTNLLCFQSLKTPSLAFVSMNPFSLNPSYAPILQEDELSYMKASKSEDLCYYVFCVVRDPVSDSTVNLKCPIVINDELRIACQVILDSTELNMRHKLSEFKNGV